MFFLIITLSFACFSIYSFRGEKVNSQEDNLISTIDALHAINAKISDWSLYSKSNVKVIDSINIFNEKEQELKEKYPQYIWEKEGDKNHHVKLIGTLKSTDDQQIITLTAYKINGKYNLLQTFTYQGAKWSLSKYNKQLNYLDNNNPIFYTVKATVQNEDNRNIKVIADNILGGFSAVTVEKLIESNFVSISAYKETWGDYLMTKNQKRFNLQLGLRKNQNANVFDLTIGSPIITQEY